MWNFEGSLALTRRPHQRATLIAAPFFVPISNPSQLRNGLRALTIPKTEPVSSLPELSKNRHVTDISLSTATTPAQTKSASQKPPAVLSDTSISRSAARPQNAVTAVSNCPAYVLQDPFTPNHKVYSYISRISID